VDLKLTGFLAKDIEELLREFDTSLDDDAPENGEVTITCPKCGHEFAVE